MNAILDENEQELSNLLVVRDSNGRVAIRIGFTVTVYFTSQLTRKVRETVAELADEYIAMVREHLRWALPPNKKQFCPIASKRVKLPSVWLPDHPNGNHWQLEFHGGNTIDDSDAFEVEAVGFEGYSDAGIGYFHVAFPLLWFSDRGGSLLEYVQRLCDRLHPISGYAGLGILEASNRYISMKWQAAVRVFAERFQGLEVENRAIQSNYLLEGIKGVNWLTVVGDRWLEELGGLSHVENQLSEGLSLSTYDGGAIIQAGPRPQIGDINVNRWPQHYVAAAKLLKKVQVKHHGSFHSGEPGHMTWESSMAWLFRFDGK